MDLTPHGVEQLPEKIADINVEGPIFHCNLFDTEIVHKTAQAFLAGLATACVDNTTGDFFKKPGSVAVDMRKEIVEYLTQRSETFVAETVILEDGTEAEASDHPFDIISVFIDDFASSKINFISRVSGWILSEKREDNIDDFIQEMELTGFWRMDRRVAIAQTLLKNVDFKTLFHCNMKFDTAEMLDEHVICCGFRSVNCENEGCTSSFCAAHREKHDSICPFMILSCEQKCPERIMRCEMDRHCITVCPMKLVNCPFHQVGCQSAFPQSMLENHRADNLHSHLLHILQVIHKDALADDLKQRAEQLEKLSSPSKLAQAQDARALISMVNELETRIKTLEEGSQTQNLNTIHNGEEAD